MIILIILAILLTIVVSFIAFHTLIYEELTESEKKEAWKAMEDYFNRHNFLR